MNISGPELHSQNSANNSNDSNTELHQLRCHCAWHELDLADNEVGALFASQTQHFEQCQYLEEPWGLRPAKHLIAAKINSELGTRSAEDRAHHTASLKFAKPGVETKPHYDAEGFSRVTKRNWRAR